MCYGDSEKKKQVAIKQKKIIHLIFKNTQSNTIRFSVTTDTQVKRGLEGDSSTHPVVRPGGGGESDNVGESEEKECAKEKACRHPLRK